MKIEVLSTLTPWSGAYLEGGTPLPSSLFTEVRRKVEEGGCIRHNPFAIVKLNDGAPVAIKWVEGIPFVGRVSDIRIMK